MKSEIKASDHMRVIDIAPERSQIALEDISTFLRRYKLVILVVFAVCVLSTYITLSFLTEQYDSKAVVIVKLGRENLDPPPTVRNTVFSAGLRREEVMSEVELMKSPELLTKVVREIGPDAFKDHRTAPSDLFGRVKFYVKAALRSVKNGYKEMLYTLNLQKRLNDEDAAVYELTEDLTVTWQKDTDVIEASVRLPDGSLARQVLSRLLDEYLRNRIEIRRGTGVDAFLASAQQQAQQDLTSAEKAEQDWKGTHDISSAKDQRTLYLQDLRQLTSEKNLAQRDLQTAQRQAEDMRQMIAKMPQNLPQARQEVPSASVSSLKQRLTTLQAERAEMLNKYSENSTVLADKNEEINRIRRLIEGEQATETASVTYSTNQQREDLEKKLSDAEVAVTGLQARLQVQNSQIAALSAKLSQLDSADSHLQDLERSRELLEAQFVSLAKRKSEADISGQLDTNRISNVSVVTLPYTDPLPAYPRKMLLIYVAMGVGLVLGLGLAIVLHYLDDEIYQPKDVQAILGAPCLGEIALAAAK